MLNTSDNVNNGTDAAAPNSAADADADVGTDLGFLAFTLGAWIFNMYQCISYMARIWAWLDVGLRDREQREEQWRADSWGSNFAKVYFPRTIKRYPTN